MATHSLVTMPVPSHSQNRKKCEGTGPRSSERWAWQRCRKMVTPAMVMWVVTRAYSSSCHHDSCHRPWAIQSTARFQTDPKSSDITEAFGKAADRKSTRLNSSHLVISYAVFCLKKK